MVEGETQQPTETGGRAHQRNGAHFAAIPNGAEGADGGQYR
jgi:hypothetical protein